MAERYTGTTRLVSIAVKGMTIRHGFRTPLSAANSTVLGHTNAVDANGVLLPSVILGANSPEPPRASKRRDSGETDSSFVGSDVIAAARTAGWKIAPGRITIPRRTSRSIPAAVAIESGSGETAPRYNYGWRIPGYQFAEIEPHLATLGIFLVTQANYQDVWFGVNKPKPNRAGRVLANNSRITTFVSSAREAGVAQTTGDTPAPSGWFLISNSANASSFGL